MAGGEGITVPIKAKITGVDEEIKKLANDLSSLDKLIGKSAGTALYDLLDSRLRRLKEEYINEIKAAGDAAVAGLSDTATDEEKAKARSEAEAKKKEELGDEPGIKDLRGGGALSALSPSESDKQMLGLLKDISDTSKGFAESAVKFTKQVFGIIEDVYKEMRKSSPLLQTIESLFNLAWQLFFMPLGNKLGEMLIPAVIKMVESVMAIWEKFEGKSLGEMLSIAITEGVKLVAQYFKEVGGILEEDTGIIKEIGQFLKALGTFIENNGVRLLEFVMTLVTFFIENIGVVINAIFESMLLSISIMAGLYAATIANHIALIVTLLANSKATDAILTAGFVALIATIGTGLSLVSAGLSTIPAAGGAAGLVALGTATGAGTVGLSSAVALGTTLGTFMGGNVLAERAGLFDMTSQLNGYSEGGYEDPVIGGVLVRVAEAGEGEWMIPDSKMDDLLAGKPLPELGLYPKNDESVPELPEIQSDTIVPVSIPDDEVGTFIADETLPELPEIRTESVLPEIVPDNEIRTESVLPEIIPDNEIGSAIMNESLPKLDTEQNVPETDLNITPNITVQVDVPNNAEFGMDKGVTPTVPITNNTIYDSVSNVSGAMSHNVFNLYIEGYTDEDLGDKIVRKLNEEMNLSRLRGGLS